VIVVLNLFDSIEGREDQYAQYLRRVQPILDRHGAKILLYGITKMIYMGDCTQEFCGLIAYPSLKELRAFSHDPEFLAIRPLRDDSTKNYVLTTIDSFETLDDAIELLDERSKNNTQQ
jgi:uncharacterized protein (DUF1330 family)